MGGITNFFTRHGISLLLINCSMDEIVHNTVDNGYTRIIGKYATAHYHVYSHKLQAICCVPQ